jgi:predicted ATPase
MPTLTNAIFNAAILSHYERNISEAERLASDVIELSTRYNFAFWLAIANILRGWGRSALGATAEGIACMENGIQEYRVVGQVLGMPYFLGLKAEALYLADRTAEALETIKEAESFAQRTSVHFWSAELRRLRGVFLTALDAQEAEIDASFCAAVRVAREQKSVSLQKRAEATYTEYRTQKASWSGGRKFRLPLC